jgi:hypothetical protein
MSAEGTAVGLVVTAGVLSSADAIFQGQRPDVKILVGTVIGGVMLGGLAHFAPELAVSLGVAVLVVVSLQAVPRVARTLGAIA